MSTPIETNTEELREILQQVYDLPDAGSGSSEPDLVINPILSDGSNDYFSVTYGEYKGRKYGPSYVTYNNESVVATYEKVMAGKHVQVVFAGLLLLNSWDGYFSTCYPCTRAIAISNDNYGEMLAVQFSLDTWFDDASIDDASIDDACAVEVDFHIDLEHRTVIDVHGRSNL